MAKTNDRRSSKLDDGEERLPLAITYDVEKAAGVQRHKDGSLRRITPGVRSLGDFFDPEQADRPLTRGDIVNALSSIFYYERESRWYRRIGRYFLHLPQVNSVAAEMARAHARGIEEMKRQLQEQVNEAADKARAFKAGAEARQ